jgi:hypothetical protein
MENGTLKLAQMQSAYKAAVEEWIAAIRQEEALASVNHTTREAIAKRRQLSELLRQSRALIAKMK